MARPEPILIVGGGLGGLTTALALSRRGLRARVLEGAPQFGAISYGIQFGPNVFHVLDRLGLMEPVLAIADAPAAVLMWDALDGKELVRIPTGASLRPRFKYPYIIVHRIDLHTVLLDACRRSDEVELVADALVASFDDQSDGVTITTADGRTFSGPALVAADGIRSLFRQKLVGDGEPLPNGCAALRTIVPMQDLKVDVPAYAGLTTRRYASGEIDWTGRISKCSDAMLRSYLYEAANVLLTRVAKWSALISRGMRVAKRSSLRKAKVAVARKLAVILHRMWVDGTEFKWSSKEIATQTA